MAVAREMSRNTLHDSNGSARDDARARLFDRYSQNLCRNIIALAEVVQRKLMAACRDEGFAGLKLSYGQVVPLIEPQGTRIIDIARSSGISKQAIGQIANDLEQQGYIVRSDDAADKRAKKLRLTSRGVELIRTAGSALGSIERQAIAVLGDVQWQSLMRASEVLFHGMQMSPPKVGQFVGSGARAQVNIATLFPALAVYVEERLMALLIERGFGELKRSFSQVLAYLPVDGVRINDLAELHGVSKQAISQIVAAIEAQGFVRLVEDDADKRAKKILLTAHGEDLLVDSVQAMSVVENEIRTVLGDGDFTMWCDQVNQLYRAWCASYRVVATGAVATNIVAADRVGADRVAAGSAEAVDFDLSMQVTAWLGALPATEIERYTEAYGGQLRLKDDVIDALRQLRIPV